MIVVNSALDISGSEVEVAITIQVNQFRRAIAADMNAQQGIRYAVRRREIGVGCCPGILKVADPAPVAAHDEVGVTVTIQVGKFRRAIRPRAHTGKRIGRAATLRKAGIGDSAGILKVIESAV